MESIGALASRPRPVAAGAGALPVAPPAEKLVGLARFVARLGSKVGPVFREHGLGTVVRRTWAHVINFRQLLAWEIHRWRLQQRVSAQRGRS